MQQKFPIGPVEFQTGFVELCEEGYLFVQMKDNMNSTIETVQESHAIFASLWPEGPIYVLVDAGRGTTADDDVFEYLVNSEYGRRVRSQAIIVYDLATRIMGNIFLRYIKNRRNMRMFSKKEDAKEWLFNEMTKAGGNESKSKKSLFFGY